jgi:hypothetical protein
VTEIVKSNPAKRGLADQGLERPIVVPRVDGRAELGREHEVVVRPFGSEQISVCSLHFSPLL